MKDGPEKFFNAGMAEYLTSTFLPEQTEKELRSAYIEETIVECKTEQVDSGDPADGQSPALAPEQPGPASASREEVSRYLIEKYGLTWKDSERMIEHACFTLKRESQNIQKALFENDMTTLANSAHTIKGTLANLGQNYWVKIAKKLELACTGKTEDDLLSLSEELGRGIALLIRR